MAAFEVAELIGVMSKSTHAHERETEKPLETPVPVGDVKMEPCMAQICDELRLNARTKIALEEYDATTLEDLAYMTNEDYESMLATATRQGRPLCPLQQRKVAVLMWWLRNLVKDSNLFNEELKVTKKPNMWERILHTPFEWHTKVHSTAQTGEGKEVDAGTVIPRNWKEQFQKLSTAQEEVERDWRDKFIQLVLGFLNKYQMDPLRIYALANSACSVIRLFVLHDLMFLRSIIS